jgi:8-amino-7-oxononanoate synthase
LVFSTGYMANTGILSCLNPPEGLLIADRLCHASLIDGCRISGSRFKVYEHKNTAQLERLLAKRPEGQPALVVTDGIFSMDGDIAPVDELVRIGKRYGADVFVDDAHATGVIGSDGRGSIAHFGIDPQDAIQMGTLGKALGCFGAYVAGSQILIDYLTNRAKTFIYTTALPPAAAAAALAAFEVLEQEQEHRERLWANRNFYAEGLKSLGFNTMDSETPIIPILIGDTGSALRFSGRLLEAGIFAPAIRPPTVPKGTARLRTTVMATHTRDDLEYVLETLGKIAHSLEIL